MKIYKYIVVNRKSGFPLKKYQTLGGAKTYINKFTEKIKKELKIENYG